MTISYAERASALAGSISNELASDPRLLSAALEGITTGMSRAIEIANARASLKDQATLAVMALSKGRVSADLRTTLLERVVAAIDPANACGYEKGYIAEHKVALAKDQPQ